MEVLLDTTALTLFLKPSVPPPHDPSTGKPLTHASARIEHAIQTLSRAHARVVIPATAWAEFLVCADESAQEYIDRISDKANFEVVPFDSISAIEAAIDQRNALKKANHKLSGTRQCVKADRQIVAIAKTRRVDAVYATDGDIARICESMGVKFIGLWELEIPASATPLLDKAESDAEAATADAATAPSSSPSEIEPPASQSPVAEKDSASQPAPAPPSAPHVGPEPQPQDSSPTVVPPPPSGK